MKSKTNYKDFAKLERGVYMCPNTHGMVVILGYSQHQALVKGELIPYRLYNVEAKNGGGKKTIVKKEVEKYIKVGMP